jgi:hypothetical protein
MKMKPENTRKSIMSTLYKHRGVIIPLEMLQEPLGHSAKPGLLVQEIEYLSEKGYLEKSSDLARGCYAATITAQGIEWQEAENISFGKNLWYWIIGRLDQIATAAGVAFVTTLITNWLTKK